MEKRNEEIYFKVGLDIKVGIFGFLVIIRSFIIDLSNEKICYYFGMEFISIILIV